MWYILINLAFKAFVVFISINCHYGYIAYGICVEFFVSYVIFILNLIIVVYIIKNIYVNCIAHRGVDTCFIQRSSRNCP